MLFDDLAAAELPTELRPDVDRLLDLKMNSPEVKEIPKIDAINEYLDREIVSIKEKIKELAKEQNNSWKVLNDLFLRTLDAYN